MCRATKNRINNLIDSKLYEVLNDYIRKYLELKNEFSKEEFSKKRNKDIMPMFNEKYGTDFTEYEFDSIVANATMSILFSDYI